MSPWTWRSAILVTLTSAIAAAIAWLVILKLAGAFL